MPNGINWYVTVEEREKYGFTGDSRDLYKIPGYNASVVAAQEKALAQAQKHSAAMERLPFKLNKDGGYSYYDMETNRLVHIDSNLEECDRPEIAPIWAQHKLAAIEIGFKVGDRGLFVGNIVEAEIIGIFPSTDAATGDIARFKFDDGTYKMLPIKQLNDLSVWCPIKL